MNNIERKADVAIEKARFLEEQKQEKEKALLEFALKNTDINPNISWKKICEYDSEGPITFVAFKNLMKHLIESPKIYYPEKYIEYFSKIMSSLILRGGLFANLTKSYLIFDCFIPYILKKDQTAVGNKIYNDEDITNFFFNGSFEKSEKEVKHYLNTDASTISGDYTLNNIFRHFIYYYLPLLLRKRPEVDLIPCFNASLTAIEHLSTLKDDNYSFSINIGHLIYLIECMRLYNEYLPVDAKERISSIILNQYFIYKNGIAMLGYRKNIYPFRVYRKTRESMYQSHGVYDDYMDLILKNPLATLSSDSLEAITFSSALNGIDYAYIAFLYCSKCDVENVSEYIDLVIALDCPIVAYHFIQRLCNKLSRSDISKIMSMLKEESPSLYLKALDILEKKITEKDSQTQVIDEPSEETHNNEISPELAQTLAAIDILLKNNPELVTSDMEKLYKTFNQDLERDAYALLDYINNLTKQRTDSSTSKANYSRNLKKRKKKDN